MAPAVVFDSVSKKFRRGERHDSLRDLVPSMVQALFRRQPPDRLGDQEFWALRDVSFEVSAGEALGIIGPNGAGKSTTLKLLTRILRPTSGRCGVRGRVGALIEVAAGFHPDLTGKENIFLQGAIMGMKRAEILARFDEIVEFAGVGDFIDTPVKRYSSGMNARLGFSIAAHLRPDVLIIDEVLSVGDMAFQQRCFDRMLEFKRQGIAIVLVSHNLQAVGSLCEKSIYLAGQVRAFGPTTEVLNAYVRASQRIEQASASDSVKIDSVELLRPAERIEANREVAAGTPLILRVTLTTEQRLEDVTFGFLIYRSTDQLLVYNGHVPAVEFATDDDLTGQFTVDLHFCAHLVQGHYYISFHIMHNPTQDFLIYPHQVMTFATYETRSRAGVADVELSAMLAPAPVPILSTSAK